MRTQEDIAKRDRNVVTCCLISGIVLSACGSFAMILFVIYLISQCFASS